MNKIDEAAMILCLLIASAFAGFLGGTLLTVDGFHDQAAKTECAQYHPVTGKFEWLEESE